MVCKKKKRAARFFCFFFLSLSLSLSISFSLAHSLTHSLTHSLALVLFFLVLSHFLFPPPLSFSISLPFSPRFVHRAPLENASPPDGPPSKIQHVLCHQTVASQNVAQKAAISLGPRPVGGACKELHRARLEAKVAGHCFHQTGRIVWSVFDRVGGNAALGREKFKETCQEWKARVAVVGVDPVNCVHKFRHPKLLLNCCDFAGRRKSQPRRQGQFPGPNRAKRVQPWWVLARAGKTQTWRRRDRPRVVRLSTLFLQPCSRTSCPSLCS
jgi:hypothetical protein